MVRGATGRRRNDGFRGHEIGHERLQDAIRFERV
jgi:hypothetical protein